MWQYNDELYHYGVLGMKWGVRKDRRTSLFGKKGYSNWSKKKQGLYDKDIQYMKNKHSKSSMEKQAADAMRNAKSIKKMSDKEYAKKRGYEGESSDFIKNKKAWELDYELETARDRKFFASRADLFSKKLDSIDTTGLSYRKARKLIKKCENDWLNDTIKDYYDEENKRR